MPPLLFYQRGFLGAVCLTFLVPGLAPPQVRAQPQNGRAAPPPALVLRDLKGVEHRPLADPKGKAVVLVFVLSDCPIANGYAPEIQRLEKDYARRGVRFFLVHVDPDLTKAEASKHGREFGYTLPIVLDRNHQLVRQAGVTKVPTAVVFAPKGERKYRGRIDDQYLALGKRQRRPTSHDLRAALEAVLAGKAVARPETEVVGCFVPALPNQGMKP